MPPDRKSNEERRAAREAIERATTPPYVGDASQERHKRAETEPAKEPETKPTDEPPDEPPDA